MCMVPDDPGSDEGRILGPDELELTDKDGVEQLDEGRYVVSADGTPPDVDSGSDGSLRDEPTEPMPNTAAPTENTTQPVERQPLDETRIQEWYEQQLKRSPTEYGYYISMKAGTDTTHHTVHSNDITTAFNDLLVWYARNIDTEMPPGAVLGILLSEANVPIQFPVKNFEEFLLDQGLSTDDTIEDLLATLRSNSRIVFPPE